ncbi:PAS domain S-box protein [Pararhodonellum marinum]|uniref:PAS domain S-box protein n=1 Tax=Pararhodonellum marinum TaxID=2755358 RepID=UPI00188E21B2|nr:PAS domain S-box protein [Pararhodonellum marinum]
MKINAIETKGQDHLKAIIDTASDAIISADQNGLIVDWNLAAERIFQYKKAEVLGKSLSLIIPKKFQKAHETGMKRVVEGHPHRVIGKVVELEGVRKNGEHFPIELSLSTWKTESGKFFSGIIRDISERKATEDKLTSSESRLRSVMETANDAIITADSKGIIQSWNRAASHIFGFTEAEALQKPLTIIIPADYKRPHENGIKRVSGGGEHHVIGRTIEITGKHKDGHLIPIELSLSTWKQGESRFYGGIIRDISERKLAEEIRNASEVKFQSITETANDAIIVGNETGHIYMWNKAAERIFGHKEVEVKGMPLSIIVPEEYKALHEAGLKRVAKGGAARVIGRTVELKGLHKDGHLMDIELSLSTWISMKQRFFCGIIRDISERKKAENQLKDQRKKLAERSRQLARLNEDVKSKNEQLQALSNKLAKYLSRQVYTSIFEGKKDVKIESYRKLLTVFFSDIQGFTDLTERVESEVLTNVLNKYLNEMSKVALDHGGTIDKYIGDAIMIFFGDPETLGEKQDALACVKMALDMKQKLTVLRKEWEAMGISHPLRIRMGINTGYCTVGNFGSEDRLDYTIVGGPVNMASRLESAAPVDEILISADTYRLVHEEVECEKRDEISVKGFVNPVQTYLVKKLYGDRNKREEQLNAQLRGFNLSIDFDQLDYADKLYARQLLEQAMSKL